MKYVEIDGDHYFVSGCLVCPFHFKDEDADEIECLHPHNSSIENIGDKFLHRVGEGVNYCSCPLREVEE